MVPTEESDGYGGSVRDKTPDTHLGVSTPKPEDPRMHFPSDEAYRAWCETRNRQCSRDPKLVGDTVSGIAAYLPADTD
jgi:hypothetical protein